MIFYEGERNMKCVFCQSLNKCMGRNVIYIEENQLYEDFKTNISTVARWKYRTVDSEYTG